MLAPTMAELARTSVAFARTGSLATLDVDGRPVVGPVPIVDDGSGSPVTVVSNLTTHTMRARQDPRAAMSINDRLLVQGTLDTIPGLQQLEIQGRFLANHPTMTQLVESLDFSWFRLKAERVRWVDDENNETWMRPEDLAGAQPDPFGDFSAEDLNGVAERLGDHVLVIVRALGGRWLARSAELVKIDRYGLTARVEEPGRRSEARVPFSERLDEVGDLHVALSALVRAAESSPSAADS